MGGIISIVETDARISFGWNVSNPSFKNENGAHLEVPYLSNLVINCPFGENVTEYYKIYWVPEELFKSCYIPYNLSKPLKEFLTCDTPQVAKYFEIFIIDFSSVVGQSQNFETGQNYYLATMSTGTQKGMDNLYAGACRDDIKGRYMKLNISVVDKPKSSTKAPDRTQPHTTRKPPTVRTTHRPTPTTSRRQPTTPSLPTSTKKATTKLKTTSRPPSTDIPDINSGDIIINGSGGGNSAIIDANDAVRSVTFSSLVVVLSICLSVLNFMQVVR